jgi:hypothetical protein
VQSPEGKRLFIIKVQYTDDNSREPSMGGFMMIRILRGAKNLKRSKNSICVIIGYDSF